MALTAYADAADYTIDFGGRMIPEEEITKRLQTASRHVDGLTYNRIKGAGFDNLTEYQQEIIKDVVCRLAEFEYENDDLIKSVLNSYSINGVSMAFGGNSWNVYTEAGVALPRDLYEELKTTGLCCRLAY